MMEKAWDRIRNDCAGFIKNFVRIKDEDTGQAAPFSLWPEQQRALKEIQEHRLTVVLKARQIGLTWLALAYAVWCMLSRSGFSVSAISRTEVEAKKLVERLSLILRYLPSWMLAYGKKSDKGITWESTSQEVKIHFPDGEDSTLIALPSAPETARSLTVSLLILDEWAFQEYAEEIWSAAGPTVNRPTGGRVIGLSTALRGTLHEQVWNGAYASENGWHPIFLAWKADPRRDAEWYEMTKKMFPHSYRREYPSTPEEAFTVGQGAAFEEWDEDIHVPHDKDWYPPPGWKLFRVYDSGYATRAACLWGALNNDGGAVIYREYYPTRTTDVDQAKTIVAMSKDPQGNAEDIAFTIADPACWQKKSADGIGTAEVFARNGVRMKQGDHDRINGWRRLHEWLKPYEGQDGQLTARLLFTKACLNTRRTMPSLVVDKSRPEDVDTDGEDHISDCLRYFVMSRPTPALSIEEKRKRAKKREKRLNPVVSKITGY